MKLALLQENFSIALNHVLHAIEAKPILPILTHVRLETRDSILQITGMNFDWSIDMFIGARVYEDGAVTLPAKFLAQLVGKLPKERIDLTLDDATQIMTLTCGESVSEIKGISITEFPALKESDGTQTICVEAKTLRAMIEQVIPAAATTDLRPILMGVYVRVEGDVLTLAAADGHQCAERTTRLDESYTRQETVVSVALLKEAARVIAKLDAGIATFRLPVSVGPVTLHIDHNVSVRGPVLEGPYPDYAASFPSAFASSVIVDVRELMRAVEMAFLAARDDANSTLFVMADRTLTVSGVSPEHGKVSQTVESKLTGDLMSVALDAVLVKAALKTMTTTRVVIYGNGQQEPVVFSPLGLPELRHLVMPMKS